MGESAERENCGIAFLGHVGSGIVRKERIVELLSRGMSAVQAHTANRVPFGLIVFCQAAGEEASIERVVVVQTPYRISLTPAGGHCVRAQPQKLPFGLVLCEVTPRRTGD